jgi:hypothetical protein
MGQIYRIHRFSVMNKEETGNKQDKEQAGKYFKFSFDTGL